MQKIQILFPNPLMRKLKEFAAQEDRPVSEVVRRAVERLLQQKPLPPAPPRTFPTFHGGGVRLPADKLKPELYRDDE
jgi:hypothetical protein